MRITNKVFVDLAILMTGFGLLVGTLFPFFILLFGLDKSIALSWYFISVCILAGAAVGSLNFIISRFIVGKRLQKLTANMKKVENNLLQLANGEELELDTLNECLLSVDSEDEIGENIQAYNQLLDALSITMFSEMLTTHLDIESLVDKALPQLTSILESNAGMILVEKEGELVVAGTLGIKSPEKIIKNDTVLSVLENNTRAHIKLPDDILIDGILTEFKPREILVEPLHYKDISLGAVLLASMNSYDEEHLLKLSIFTRSLSLALHNAVLLNNTQKLAALDPLTGTLNRRFGLSRLKEEYAKSVRSGNPLSVLLIDIDHFKKINDIYGHLAGDKVLVNTVRLISLILREGDILLRYGGEEFCIILPGASSENAFRISERIRSLISENKNQYNDLEISITVSIGISSYPELNVKHESDLIMKADNALYRSKESGRNRTTIDISE